MEQSKPILFIDDDPDDHLLYGKLLKEITKQHPILFFEQAQAALDYLHSTEEAPFLIISEMRMNGMDGLELRRQLNADPVLRKRTIPFVFFTSNAQQDLVEEAYELTVQGLFDKSSNLNQVKTQLGSIIAYWQDCIHPNRFTP